MDVDLLIPATAALLDGWCGPVVYRDATGTLCRGVVVSSGPNTAAVFALDGADAGGMLPVSIVDVRMDCGRAECRDRVARVLATWCAGSTTAPSLGWDGGDQTWMLGGVAFRRVDVREPLATLLPDGSRLADALALAAIAREVLRG